MRIDQELRLASETEEAHSAHPGYSAYARMAACDNAETEDAEGDRLQFTAVISKLHDLIACCMRGKSYALCVCLVLQYLL